MKATRSTRLGITIPLLCITATTAVGQQVVPGEVVFQARAGAAANVAAALEGLDLPTATVAPFAAARRVDAAGVARIHRLTVPIGDEAKAAALLAQAPFVEWAEPLRREGGATGRVVPDDVAWISQWSLDAYTDIDMDVPEAWELRGTTKVDTDLVIAVTDTGWDFTLAHADLVDVVWTNTGELPGNGIDDDGNGFVDDAFGYDFADDDGDTQSGFEHGTWVGSVIVAHTGNAEGIAGVADGARVLVSKILDDNGGFPTSGPFAGHLSAAAGIVYAVDNGAHVINCSWTNGQTPSMVINTAIDYAIDNGVHVVVAAGNIGMDRNWPGEHPDVIAVTGIAPSGHKSLWCSFIGCQSACYGPWVDLSAGGTSVPALGPGIIYPWTSVSFNGTSAAAPQVAGVAAMVLSEDRDLSTEDLRELLMASAVSVAAINPQYDGWMGAGHVNAHAALQLLAPFTDLGQGLAGATSPVLNAWGGVDAGNQLTFSTSRATPNAPGVLVLGGSPLQLPVFGGVLVPSPDLVFGIVTDADGARRVGATLPVDLVAGANLWAQTVVLDLGAPQSFALSNAVRVTGS